MTTSYDRVIHADGLSIDTSLSPTASLSRVVHWRAAYDLNLLELNASETFAALMVPYMERFNALMRSPRPLKDLEQLAAEIGESLARNLHALTEADTKILGPIYQDWSVRIQRQVYYEDGHSGPHFFGSEVCRTFYETLKSMKQDKTLPELCGSREAGMEQAKHILASLDSVDADTPKQLNWLFK